MNLFQDDAATHAKRVETHRWALATGRTARPSHPTALPTNRPRPRSAGCDRPDDACTQMWNRLPIASRQPHAYGAHRANQRRQRCKVDSSAATTAGWRPPTTCSILAASWRLQGTSSDGSSWWILRHRVQRRRRMIRRRTSPVVSTWTRRRRPKGASEP